MSMLGIQPQVYSKINLPFVPGVGLRWDNQPMVSKAGVAIKEALKRMGKTQGWLAEKVGVSDNAVSKWIKTGKIASANIPAISSLLKISSNDILPDLDSRIEMDPDKATAQGNPTLSNSQLPPAALYFRPPLEVPIVGTTQGGPPDRIWEELSYPVGYSDEYLEVSTADEHAYALRVVGNSMAPRIMEGEWLLVEPSKAVYPGDDVVVKTVEGEVMVKRLISDRDGKLVLASINEAFQQITVGIGNAVFMHYVGGIHPARSAKQRISCAEEISDYGRRHHQAAVEVDRRLPAYDSSLATFNLENSPRITSEGKNPPRLGGTSKKKSGAVQ